MMYADVDGRIALATLAMALADVVCILCPWRLLARLLGVQSPRPACPPSSTAASTRSCPALPCPAHGNPPSSHALAGYAGGRDPDALQHVDDRTMAYRGL